MAERGTLGSNPPASPSVTMQYVTSMPRSVQAAMLPAAPKSTSSGCAVTTSTRSIWSSSSMRARLRPDQVVRLGLPPGTSGRLVAMSITGPTPSLLPLAEIDISAPEFWLADRDYREAAFRTLREQAPVTVLRRAPVPQLPTRPRVLGAHPPRRRLARQPQPAAVLLEQGHEHPRPADGDQRVHGLDDQHGRSEALPPPLDRLEGLHAEGGGQDRGLRGDEGRGRSSTM